MAADFAGYRPVMWCYNPAKVGSGVSYHAASDTAYTAEGNPAIPPDSDEREIGRWEFETGENEPCAIVDMRLDDEERGPGNPDQGESTSASVFGGDARCLVTDRALRFTAYRGTIRNFGNAGRSAVLAFTVPLVDISKIDAGRSNAFHTAEWITIDLERSATVVSVFKASKANAKFRSGIFATGKNKEFVAQVESARFALG